MGTVHGEELPYVFGAPLVDGFSHFPKNYTRSEMALSESIILYFNNFARTGNPNEFQKQEQNLAASKEKNRFRNIVWDEYDSVHQKYLEISMKPKMKNHFRAHQLSVWLRLIPELHRAGMEDVVARHNLFRNHDDADLYDGVVRPDPLSRGSLTGIYDGSPDLYFGPTGSFSGTRRRGNGSVDSLPEPVTTMDTLLTTCVTVVGGIQGQSRPLQHGNTTSDTLASLEAAGYTAYSTALSVTIAIGCSLLILNVMIFAGVYYQRDKTRLEVKSLQQQQHGRHQNPGGSFDTIGKSRYHTGSASVIVDVEPDTSAMILAAGNAIAPSPSHQTMNTLTKQHNMVSHLLKAPPPSPNVLQQQQQLQGHHTPHITRVDHITLTDNLSALSPPNGSAVLPLTVPPPPRNKSPPESQPLLSSHHTLRVPTAAMDEMRV